MEKSKRNWFIVGGFRCFRDFLTHTSSHGMKYVGEDDRTSFERIFWLGIISIGLGTSTYMVMNIYGKYTSAPTVMSLDRTDYPTWRVPFPAVTLCNPNPIIASQAQLVINQLKLPDYMNKSTVLATFEELSILNNPDLASSKTSFELELILKLNNLQAHQLLLKLTQPCSEMLESCWWENKPINCSKIFSQQMSHLGVCCSFNYDPYEEDFRPIHSQLYGKSTGLTVLMKAQRQPVSSFLSAGIAMMIHDPFVYPDQHVTMKVLQFNTEVLIPISNVVRLCSEGVAALSPSTRGCLFPSEGNLSLFPRYLDDNCLTECRINYLLTHCGCVPYYYPRKEEQRVCDLTDLPCEYQNFESMHTYRPSVHDEDADVEEHRTYTRAAQHNMKAMSCNCPTQCEGTIRHSHVSYSTFNTNGPTLDLKMNKSDRIIMHVFLESDTSQVIVKEVSTTASSALGLVGGIASLCLGCSLVTPIEFTYFLIIRLSVFTGHVTEREGSSCPASPRTIHPERYPRADIVREVRYPSVRTQNMIRDLLRDKT